MGYRDYKLLLAASQTVTEEVSDFYVDTEQVNPGWEKGVPMGIVINVETAGSGSTGYVIHVVHKANGAPTLGDSTLISLTVPVANLAKGAEIVIPFPQGIPILRYVGLHFADISADESLVVSAYITPLPVTGQ